MSTFQSPICDASELVKPRIYVLVTNTGRNDDIRGIAFNLLHMVSFVYIIKWKDFKTVLSETRGKYASMKHMEVF